MKTRAQMWGNSLAVRIPPTCAIEARIAPETPIEVSVQDGNLVMRPILAPSPRLDELLARITPENLHAEIEFGDPVGNEVW